MDEVRYFLCCYTGFSRGNHQLDRSYGQIVFSVESDEKFDPYYAIERIEHNFTLGAVALTSVFQMDPRDGSALPEGAEPLWTK